MQEMLSPKQVVAQAAGFDPRIGARWRGNYLYLDWDGFPLARLQQPDPAKDLWLFALYKASTEKYSLSEFGDRQQPLPLEEQLAFAVGFAESLGL